MAEQTQGGEPEKEYILYFYDGSVRRVTGKLSQLQRLLPVSRIEEAPAEDTVGTRILKTLVTGSINDITYEQMNRIVRRLSRMPQRERGIPKRVADVLADELGPQKALQYIDKALAAGQIKAREYDEMRAALLLPMPRKEIPAPTIRRMAAELVQGQEKIREDFRKLTGQGQQAFQKPFKAVDEDVKRMRKALGL